MGHNAVEVIMRRLGIKGLPTRRLPRGARLANLILDRLEQLRLKADGFVRRR